MLSRTFSHILLLPGAGDVATQLMALRMLHVTLRLPEGFRGLDRRPQLDQLLLDLLGDAGAPACLAEAAIDVMGNLFVQMPPRLLNRPYILHRIAALFRAEEDRRGDAVVVERVMWALSNLLYVEIHPFPESVIQRALLYLEVRMGGADRLGRASGNEGSDERRTETRVGRQARLGRNQPHTRPLFLLSSTPTAWAWRWRCRTSCSTSAAPATRKTTRSDSRLARLACSK